jgi:hypothetical protein
MGCLMRTATGDHGIDVVKTANDAPSAPSGCVYGGLTAAAQEPSAVSLVTVTAELRSRWFTSCGEFEKWRRSADQTLLLDAWNRALLFYCADDLIFVFTAGPDGRYGTRDDRGTVLMTKEPYAP